MAAPLAWLQDAYAKRAAILADGGPEVLISVGSWGVTIIGESAAIGRSWEYLDSAKSNPLVPGVEVVARRKRAA